MYLNVHLWMVFRLHIVYSIICVCRWHVLTLLPTTIYVISLSLFLFLSLSRSPSLSLFLSPPPSLSLALSLSLRHISIVLVLSSFFTNDYVVCKEHCHWRTCSYASCQGI